MKGRFLHNILLFINLTCPVFFYQKKAFSETVITHNLTASQNENVLSYELAVLKLILDKSSDKYGGYQLKKSIQMSQSRAFQELSQENSIINVIATMTSIDREKKAEPIRICLFKGLLGVRIPIILKSEKDKLEKTLTLKNLQKLTVGQVFDWPDTKILEGNNFHVEKTTSYPALFPMLNAKRFNIFPLGALEVYQIAKQNEDKYNISVIENWAIAYPTGYYFFVNKKDKKLYSRLQYGFIKSIKDGSFESLFNKYNNEYLKKAHLESRKIFYLKNKILPKSTPLNKQELWHPIIRKDFSSQGSIK